MDIKVSVFASAVRPKLWEACFKSLLSTSVDFEVVFSGYCLPEDVTPFIDKYPFLRYIYTDNIKPSQNYEIARRACKGETVLWFCDDGECPDDVIGKAYNYWREAGNEKLILSIQTKESGYGLREGQLFPMHQHLLKGPGTPLMAPLGLMSRKFLDQLGGVDRRYICGQYENSTVMQAYQAGGTVEIFGGWDCFIDIDHLGKSIAIGESKDENYFLARPFALGYPSDRKVLEASWILPNGKVSNTILSPFEKFEDEGILEKSQSNNLPSRWV